MGKDSDPDGPGFCGIDREKGRDSDLDLGFCSLYTPAHHYKLPELPKKRSSCVPILGVPEEYDNQKHIITSRGV